MVKKLGASVQRYAKQLYEASIKVLFKPGDIVEYNGKEWLLRDINASGFAQLTDVKTGRKFPGTPRPDKLTFVRKSGTLEQIKLGTPA